MLSKAQNQLVQDFKAKLIAEDTLFFDQILSILKKIEYIPEKNNTKMPSIIFKNKKLNKKIAKFAIHGDDKLHFYTKYFSIQPYPEKCIDSLRFLYTKYGDTYWTCDCENCKKCTGLPERYTYCHSDGKEIFYCGSYLYEIRNISINDIKMIEHILLKQHQYFCIQQC